MVNETGEQNTCARLSDAELEIVSGGMMKIPGTGTERYKVLYDDGITIVTTKPGASNG